MKRKAEFSPCIGSNLEGYTPKRRLFEVSAKLEHKATATEPTAGEHCGGVPVIHIDSALANVAEGAGLGNNSFWALLALAGYEAW